MFNFANGRVNLKFSNSVLVQKSNSSWCSNCILKLYIFHELNIWPRILANSFTLKYCLLGTVKLVRKVIKSKFTYNGQGIAFYGEASWSFGNEFAGNLL